MAYYKGLRVRRKSMGLTLRELATETGMGYGYLCDIENGKYNDLRLSTLRKLSKAYQIDLLTVVLIIEGRL